MFISGGAPVADVLDLLGRVRCLFLRVGSRVRPASQVHAQVQIQTQTRHCTLASKQLLGNGSGTHTALVASHVSINSSRFARFVRALRPDPPAVPLSTAEADMLFRRVVCMRGGDAAERAGRGVSMAEAEFTDALLLLAERLEPDAHEVSPRRGLEALLVRAMRSLSADG